MLSTIQADNIKSPVRQVKGAVAVYRAATLLNTYTYKDELKEFVLQRDSGGSKFFGYGVVQRLNVKFRDFNRNNPVKAGDMLKIKLDCNNGNTYAFTTGEYYVSECRRDELTNELSVFAYDKLADATEHYTSEIDFSACDTFYKYMQPISILLGLSGVQLYNLPEADANKAATANIEGSETIRDLLDDIAEALQCIYFVSYDNKLVFRRLDKTAVNLTIGKADYISLDSGENRRLQTICATNELGNSISASTTQIGTTQFIRDNVFWSDIDNFQEEVNNALTLFGDLSINQFECVWRGDYRLEVGDRLCIVNKDGSNSYSYFVDDTLTYNGFFQQETKWEYEDNEGETASNPTSLGDALKQTFAKVDKVNKQIDIVAADVDNNGKEIAAIKLETDEINASVSNISESNKASIDSINQNIVNLIEQVNTAITSDELAIEVSKQIENGVDKITTSTGFTFNEEGLTVNKSGTDISTKITEDGMKIYRNEDIMLTANNKGVDAYNLHATTYLIVGLHSRFEDFGERTGCFWIGEQGYNPENEVI